MTKSKIQSAWKRVAREMKNVPDWEKIKEEPREYRRVVLLREMLWVCRSMLEKIRGSENEVFNFLIFQKSMNFYREQIKKYV